MSLREARRFKNGQIVIITIPRTAHLGEEEYHATINLPAGTLGKVVNVHDSYRYAVQFSMEVGVAVFTEQSGLDPRGASLLVYDFIPEEYLEEYVGPQYVPSGLGESS